MVSAGFLSLEGKKKGLKKPSPDNIGRIVAWLLYKQEEKVMYFLIDPFEEDCSLSPSILAAHVEAQDKANRNKNKVKIIEIRGMEITESWEVFPEN